MKLARLSVLTAAMILTSAAQANDLMSDGSLDLHLRNYFLDATGNLHNVNLNVPAKHTDIQWSQAISVNFTSGFYENIIGFDLGAHYALKLRGDVGAGDSGPGLLPVDGNGNASSYGKTSYAVKINLADMGVAKYGRMQMDTPLLNDNYSRSLPGLTEAFYAEGNFEGASLYGIWATKSNMRTESGFVDLMVNDKKQSVKVLGGGYDFGNGFAANLAAGQQSDFARRYYFDAGYAMDMQGISLDSSFKYGRNNLIGYSKPAQNSTQDDSQSTWGLSVELGMQQATLGLSYQRVSQSGFTTYSGNWKGQEDTDMAGYFGPNSLMISDFNYDGEKSWGVNAGYDFTGMVDGLSVALAYAKGDIKTKGGLEGDEKEYNLTATYALPQVENLSLSAQYAKNTAKNKANNDKATKSQVRVIAKYDFSVF